MSELALKLIEENKKTRSPFLDLGNCGLTEIPVEIDELVWLEELSFASSWSYFEKDSINIFKSLNKGTPNNFFTLYSKPKSNNESFVDKFNKDDLSINPFSNLKRLKKLFINGSGYQMEYSDLTPISALNSIELLNISYTKIHKLDSIEGLYNLCQLSASCTLIDSLAPVSNIINIRVIFVFSTYVNDLEPLSRLSNLELLYVNSCPVKELKSIANLNNLKQLNISSTLAKDLSSLSKLKKLSFLDISNTKIYDLSPLSKLESLTNLSIRTTAVIDLTPLGALKNLKFIDVENCRLIYPPTEIIHRGSSSILNFLREAYLQGIDQLYEAKMLLIGEGGSGKTSLARRLFQQNAKLPDENETTKGIDIYRYDFKLENGRIFRLNVWDFGGQEIYHATHQFFLTKRSLYVLLDDTRKDDRTVHDPGFKYWLEVADLLSGHSPILIFQNEKGGRSKSIDESGIKAKFVNVKGVYQGNLEFPGSADVFRKAIELYVQTLPHIGEELPAKWISIRAEIEQVSVSVPYISQNDYFDIYRKYLEFDKEKALHLSLYLHDLGVFLHFQDEDLLKKTIILQNTWATEAVFKMLDDEIVKAKLGHFNKADCERAWQDSAYSEMHIELLALMQKFELCYQLPDVNQYSWLAPQLLPPSKPVDLNYWAFPNGLTLRYRYEFLPKGIISRLIVRMHRFVLRPNLSWVNGALFERDGTECLAEVTPKGNEIVLRARGHQNKELLSVISADLDALNDSFQGLKDLVSKWIPCTCRDCCQLIEPEYFEQKRLVQRKKDGKLKVECPASYEDVDVLEMLDGIRVDRLPVWAKDEDRSKSSAKQNDAEPKTIKIFLASSSELKEDRDAFDLYFRQQNDVFRKQGLYLEIVRWENFLDAMSETRLQDEYNQEVKACDIFVSLFFTKTGKFTEEEFDTALRLSFGISCDC